MAERQTLPVLPLRGTVIFPGLTVPIGVGRPGTLHAIEAALKGNREILAVAQRENVDEPTPDQLYTMGVIGRIGQVQRGLGGVQLLLQGEHRATVLNYHNGEEYLTADVMAVEELPPIDENDAAFAALYKETRERAMELGERRGLPEEVLHQVLDSVTEPGRFADLVAGYVELPVAEKQLLLETPGIEERLRRVLIQVQRQIGMLAAQDEIKSQVQEELGERQREMFLREQLKTIQKELGEDDQSREMVELREKLGPARPAARGAGRGRARARPARTRRARVDGSPGDPDLPGVDRRTALEQPIRRRPRPQARQQGARRGPLRPEGRQGPRARIPGRAAVARPQDRRRGGEVGRAARPRS